MNEQLRADILASWSRVSSFQEQVALLNRCYVALGEQQVVPEWVPVSERLPDIAQEVIVHTEFDGVCAGVLDSYGEWFAPCSEYKLTRVTHWMPLPAAPAIAAARQEGGKV